MRQFTALLALHLLAACQCLHSHQHSHTPRLLKQTLHDLLQTDSKPVRRIIKCTRTLGVSKCISALGAWRAERAVEAFSEDPRFQFNLTEDVERFPWMKYTNITDEELDSQLLVGTQKLLQYRPLTFDMISGYEAQLHSMENGFMNIDLHKTNEVEGRSSMKKIQKELYRLLPFILAPGVFISALVPFILPSLKMMIGMVGLMNKVALIGAIFTVLRNNAFNDKPSTKVIYINNGYQNDKLKFSASNNEEHYHTNHLGVLYEDQKAPLPIQPSAGPDDPFDGFESIDEIPELGVSPSWIKQYTDNKMMNMIRNQPHENLFYDGAIPIRRTVDDAKKDDVHAKT